MDTTPASEVRSWTRTDLAVRASIFPSGWQTALGRAPRIEVKTIRLAAERPQVVSLALAGQKVDAWGIDFPQGPSLPKPAQRPGPQSGPLGDRPKQDVTMDSVRIVPAE